MALVEMAIASLTIRSGQLASSREIAQVARGAEYGGKERALIMLGGDLTNRRKRPRLRRPVLGGFVIASATISMACLAGSASASLDRQSAAKLLRSAYSQTVESKTAKVTFTETVDQSTLPLHTTVTGQGSIDFKSGNGALTFSSSAVGSFSDRFINPDLYIQLPAADKGQVPGGKAWISINLNTVTEAKLGQSLAQLTSSSQESTQLLSYLQSVSSTGVTTAGPATIKGVSTTEYKATVDLTKVADQKSPAEQAVIKNTETELGTTMLPEQVWLDSQGRVRQVATQIQVSTAAQSNGSTTIPAVSGSVSTTVDYFDFGTPVTVQAPAASQVDDITGKALAAASSTTTTGG